MAQKSPAAGKSQKSSNVHERTPQPSTSRAHTHVPLSAAARPLEEMAALDYSVSFSPLPHRASLSARGGSTRATRPPRSTRVVDRRMVAALESMPDDLLLQIIAACCRGDPRLAVPELDDIYGLGSLCWDMQLQLSRLRPLVQVRSLEVAQHLGQSSWTPPLRRPPAHSHSHSHSNSNSRSHSHSRSHSRPPARATVGPAAVLESRGLSRDVSLEARRDLSRDLSRENRRDASVASRRDASLESRRRRGAVWRIVLSYAGEPTPAVMEQARQGRVRLIDARCHSLEPEVSRLGLTQAQNPNTNTNPNPNPKR